MSAKTRVLHPRARNLENQKFNELTVLYPTDERFSRSIIWMCQCSCGNLVQVPGHYLTTNQTKNCGHSQILDVRTEKFGKWTALYPTSNRDNGHVMWMCECDCGTRKLVSVDSLVRTDSKHASRSCGKCK